MPAFHSFAQSRTPRFVLPILMRETSLLPAKVLPCNNGCERKLPVAREMIGTRAVVVREGWRFLHGVRRCHSIQRMDPTMMEE